MVEAPNKLSKLSKSKVKHSFSIIIIIMLMITSTNSLGIKEKIGRMKRHKALMNLDKALAHLTDVHKSISAHVQVTCLKFTNGGVNNTYHNLKKCEMYKLQSHEMWASEMGTIFDELRHFRRALFMKPAGKTATNPQIMDLIDEFLNSHKQIVDDAKAVARFITNTSQNPEKKESNATNYEDYIYNGDSETGALTIKLNDSDYATQHVNTDGKTAAPSSGCTASTIHNQILEATTSKTTTTTKTTKNIVTITGTTIKPPLQTIPKLPKAIPRSLSLEVDDDKTEKIQHGEGKRRYIIYHHEEEYNY